MLPLGDRLGEIANDAVFDAAIAGVWAYNVGHYSKTPWQLFQASVATGFMQPILSAVGEGMFAKQVKCISPMLSTAFCYGVCLLGEHSIKSLTFTGDGRFYAITSVAYIALVKGATFAVTDKSPYPSLVSVVKAPIAIVKGIGSLFSSVMNSQFVRSRTAAIYSSKVKEL
ncbi:MAG: hypothetical protein JSR37_07010 [Verrucomicrobia bacterium]|nr:hypothetical protein [Verrucomicrobiota bacterium]MBS0637617.1 hypothetical protein [Verrucomicrobiota bacterium]